ncbi:hypothetical protein DAEQUDRAFT_140430 [Daedalea quercina L-15889]|uniref:Uncharacterized protein n=1 Tax=Daedalea quercina L-15889 TaxID=1314783 RepID=A0A165RU19_9APHY|nr:hypothetical protein DAEQUDRAFT_140430 [Daedalea quercina L-15889]
MYARECSGERMEAVLKPDPRAATRDVARAPVSFRLFAFTTITLSTLYRRGSNLAQGCGMKGSDNPASALLSGQGV